MKYMHVTNGWILVDAFMYPILRDIPWWMHHSGYAMTKINGRHVAMHRLILMAPEGTCVDHINRDRSDNRFKNLRLCSKQVNAFNANKPKSNTTGYKGVHFHRKNKSYVAYIGKKPRVHLGCFSTAEAAAKAYNDAAKERYGMFAALNIIRGAR